VEQLGQSLTCTVQPRLHAGWRHPQDVGDVLVRALLDVTQEQDDPLVLRQLLDAGPHPRACLFALEQRVRSRASVNELMAMVPFASGAREQRLDRFCRLPSLGPQLHQRRVHNDSMQPGRELAVAFEFLDSSKRVQVRGLADIQGILVVLREPSRDGEEPSAIHANYRVERPVLSRLQRGDQRRLVDNESFR
jgi:hypothetical protein